MSEVEAILNDAGITTKSGFKQVYNYLADTGEYAGSNKEYLQIGVGIPALSTLEPVPEFGEKEAAVYSLKLSSWTVLQDFRGNTVYSTQTGEPILIDAIGPLPENVTELKPSSSADVWTGVKWVESPEKAQQLLIDDANAKKNTLLSVANEKTNDLILDYNLGLLEDSQIEELKSWRLYIRSLEKVDTSTAPNISWPVSPESVSS